MKYRPVDVEAGHPIHADPGEIILELRGLRTSFQAGGTRTVVVDGVDLALRRGKTLCVVGESGCGKSMLSLSIMGLLPPSGRAEGSILFDGTELVGMPSPAMRRIRGRRIAMIFQEPMTSLNPVLTIGFQIVEALRAHHAGLSAADLQERAVAVLEQVRMPAAAQRFGEYPHQLSGGMRQRAMIAMALACSPDVLIADEPTTALDVTVQAEIMELMRDLQRQTGMSIVLITHDLGVVAEMADDVAVMYAGRIVEKASCRSLFDDPQHPYTLGLLGSIPRLESDATRLLAIEGSVPLPFEMPAGCRFHPRCVFAEAGCTQQRPALREIAFHHHVACRLAPLEEIQP